MMGFGKIGRVTANGGISLSLMYPPPSLTDGRRPAVLSRDFAADDSTLIKEAWSAGLAATPAATASSRESGFFWAEAPTGRPSRTSATAKARYFLDMTGLRS